MLRPSAVPLVAASVLALGAVAAVASMSEVSVRRPCVVPDGVDPAALGERDRGYVARRLLACADLEEGRITPAEYRAELARLDAPAPAVARRVRYASHVRAVSTEYSPTSWSAAMALGAPDVFPGAGDDPRAWASRGADDRVEYLEVGFDEPARISAVEIFETFHPGAVRDVEVVFATGRRQRVLEGGVGAIAAPSHRRVVEVPCTAEPVVAVRVTIDSPAVEGWNEIDAIGVVSCE